MNGYSHSSRIDIPDGLEFKCDQFVIPSCYKNDLRGIILSEGMIEDRIKKMADDIHKNIGDQPLTLICVLKGSYRFFTTFVKELTAARSKCQTQIVIDFIRAVSYEDTATTGQLKLIGLSSLDELKNRNVVIVDDIIDSGLTLSRLVSTIKAQGASKVWTTVLFSKRVKRSDHVHEHFIGFSIPNEFVVGFGLDYNQRYRDLGHVGILTQGAIDKYKM